jgi:hypothetical protein
MMALSPTERGRNSRTTGKWCAIGVEGKFETGERPVLDFGEYGKFKIYAVAANPYDYIAYRCVPGSIYCPLGFLADVLEHPNTLDALRSLVEE